MRGLERGNREVKWQFAGIPMQEGLGSAREDAVEQGGKGVMTNIDFASQNTGIAHTPTASRPRLDEILSRHRQRRIKTVALLVVWTVFCGAILAL
jgi:hypothetical protein